MVMNSPIKQNKVGNITSCSNSRSQSNSSVRGSFEDYDQGSSSARNDRIGQEQQVGKVNIAMMHVCNNLLEI